MGKEDTSTKSDQEKNHSTNRGQNRYRGGGGGDRKPPYKTKERFKGESTDMGGHIFQCHSEQRIRGEFDETMRALKTFASAKYVAYIDYLTPIFVDILEPTLVKPKLRSTEEELVLSDGTTRKVNSSSTEELEEFKMKL